ncbi:hypothetical protein ACVWWO_005248 [Bradyrhizobium sp. F1.13.1]
MVGYVVIFGSRDTHPVLLASQTISNLLSKGTVNEDGTPGPNFAQAQQYSVGGQTSFFIGAPTISKSPYNATNQMPQPNTNGTPTAQSDTSPPFKTVAEASVETDADGSDLDVLTTGFSGLAIVRGEVTYWRGDRDFDSDRLRVSIREGRRALGPRFQG